MNLIVNFSTIESEENLKKYNLKIDGKTIIEKIISQVQLRDVNNIILLVNPLFTKQFNEIIYSFKFASKIVIQELLTEYQKDIAKSLVLDDITSAYQVLTTLDKNQFFATNFDSSLNTILIDGSKLYKKNIFNFTKATSDIYIKFVDKEKKFISNYILFLCTDNSGTYKEVKNVIVDDYISNFIDMRELKTLIQSSAVFEDNKQLRYEYINQLMEELQFIQVIDESYHFATKNRYWMMFYLELLIGYGYEQQFLHFYISNKEKILNIKFTVSQKRMYSKIFDLFEKIDNDQPLVNEDIKGYLNSDATDFKFVLALISHSPSKELNLGYLLSGLIEKERLTQAQAEDFLQLISTLEVNPYVKMYYITSLVKYFISSQRINTISHNFINLLFAELHTNEALFTKGVESLTLSLGQDLDIKNKDQHSNKDVADLSTIPQLKSKVAICITGVAKFNYEKNLELMKHFFSNLDADYFIQTWDTYEKFPALSDFGAANPDWSGYYMARIKKELPKFIERQTNFEALMPQTARLLFTKEYESLSKKEFIDIFGSNLKKIKKFSYSEFLKKIKLGSAQSSKLNDELVTIFERQVITEALEQYMIETNQRYQYVINIDINTMLKSKVDVSEFEQIAKNQVYVLGDEKNQVHSGMTVSRLETARQFNKIWSLCQSTNSVFPYTICDQNVFDMDQNILLLTLLHKGLQWRMIDNNFGAPYINKKIIMPKMMETVNSDLETYEGDKQSIINYFTKAEQLFTSKINNNIRYQNITSAALISYQITEAGISLDISIKGKDLKSLVQNNFYLYGVADLSIDSDLARSRLYKQGIEFLKHEDDEIVIRKDVSDQDLMTGKSWKFTILFHNYTLTHINIEFDSSFENVIELCKYGLKYIEFDHGFRVGMYTKSFLLNGMNN